MIIGIAASPCQTHRIDTQHTHTHTLNRILKTLGKIYEGKDISRSNFSFILMNDNTKLYNIVNISGFRIF